MRKQLALNRHWYDVLWNYSSTALKFDLKTSIFHPDSYKAIQELLESLKQENLSQLMHLKFENIEGIWVDGYRLYYYKERLDVAFILILSMKYWINVTQVK